MAKEKKDFKAAFDNFIDKQVGRFSTKAKLGILLISLLAPAVLFYFFGFSPMQKKLNTLSKEITGLEKQVAEAAKAAKEIDKHKAEKKEIETRFKVASKLLPQQKEIPGLLTSISGEGTNSGLEIMNFTPGGEIPEEFYASFPINISLKGPYHNIGGFLDKISKLDRIVSVSKLSLSSPSLVEGEMILSASLSLVTYRFIGDEKKEK